MGQTAEVAPPNPMRKPVSPMDQAGAVQPAAQQPAPAPAADAHRNPHRIPMSTIRTAIAPTGMAIPYPATTPVRKASTEPATLAVRGHRPRNHVFRLQTARPSANLLGDQAKNA